MRKAKATAITKATTTTTTKTTTTTTTMMNETPFSIREDNADIIQQISSATAENALLSVTTEEDKIAICRGTPG